MKSHTGCAITFILPSNRSATLRTAKANIPVAKVHFKRIAQRLQMWTTPSTKGRFLLLSWPDLGFNDSSVAVRLNCTPPALIQRNYKAKRNRYVPL